MVKERQATAGNLKAFVVPEINLGQVVMELERVSSGGARVISVPHAGGGVHNPKDIYEKIKAALKETSRTV